MTGGTHRWRRRWAAPALVVALGAAAALTAAQEPAGDPQWDAMAQPFLENHCFQCHRGKKPKGDFHIDRLAPAAAPVRDPEAWRRIRHMLVTREMPPKRVTPPEPAEYRAMIGWIDGRLKAWQPAGPADPGRVTLRRLNRAEYTNTVRDLLGVSFQAGDSFPADDVGNGFDNNGDVLSLPPILLEKYLAAAERIAAGAIRERDAREVPRQHLAGAECKKNGRGHTGQQISYLATSGEFHHRFQFARDGLYTLRAWAFGQQAGPDVCRAEWRLDGRRVARVEVPAVAADPAWYETSLRVTGGGHTVAFAFVNDFYNPKDPDPKNRDRNMALVAMEVVGPIDHQELPDSHTRWLPAGATLRGALHRLAEAAFRRPVNDTELAALVRLARTGAGKGATLEQQFRLGLTAVLVSPHFLFRVELHPAPMNATAVRPVGDWALASRLSYFLWSSMPDARLFELARADRLHQPDVLRAEVDRMLRDPRASALAANFAPQWLQIRALAESTPDADRFPGFDDPLRRAMELETRLFFDAILREERSVWELLDADFTFVNARLARHYGIPGVRGTHMRRVALGRFRRGGVLAHGSVLTATSNPTRTSPVRRGKWVLSALLDQAPPPPPPGLDGFDERPAEVAGSTLRERLEQHRANPKCAICHRRMDTLGFALETYDAVGRRRTSEGRFPIDAKGTLPDGRVVDGPAGLAAVLKGDPAFLRSLSRHLLIYALGRGLGEADRPAVDRCVAALQQDPTLHRLIRTITELPAFQQHRGEPRTEGF